MKGPNGVKVLHVLGRLNRGGAEMRTLELMRCLDRTSYRFEFCCLSGLPGELDDDVRALGGKVHLVKLGIGFPSRFERLLLDGGYDAVHSHVHWPSGYISRLAAKAGVRQRICHFRSTSDGRIADPVTRLRTHMLKKWVEQYSTDILGVSIAALECSIGPRWQFDPRCKVIYNGLDLEPFAVAPDRLRVREEFGLDGSALLVAHVGRMDPPKNHERLLQIFARIAERLHGSYLLLVGARRENVESRLRVLGTKLRVEGRIIVAGLRSDVPRLLGASDIMVFPSKWEGLPGAVLEGAAAGLPVVASELPSIVEISKNLPGIRTVSLERTDDEWATTAIEMYLRTDRCSKETFLRSPFSMEASVAGFQALYQRGCCG